MVDIHSILADYRPKNKDSGQEQQTDLESPTFSKIPDLFFDEILINVKLSRIEIIVLMYLYRRVWCRPNLYKEFGISPLLSHSEMGRNLNLSIDEVHHCLRSLEQLQFITTIRSGQYFVRRYFSRENDDRFGVSYDDFDD